MAGKQRLSITIAIMSSYLDRKELYHGVATVVFPNGKIEEYEVALWGVERITERLVLGPQLVPPREDVGGYHGEILTPLPESKLAELASTEPLYLQYGDQRWKISLPNSRRPEFTAGS
jgi:hypothetical protein